jgi:hypothetical protein
MTGIELMLERCHNKDEIVPSWSTGDLPFPRRTRMPRVSLFAIDLLHAELRLRRCESEDAFDAAIGSDGVTITDLSRCIEVTMNELEAAEDTGATDWKKLKTRCQWFLSSYYLWRSRVAQSVVDSKEAESISLDYIEHAIRLLSDSERGRPLEIPVPHLDSPLRSGPYWKVLTVSNLIKFRDEVQAASVVLLARDQFASVVKRLETEDTIQELTEEDADALFAIGDSLLTRYGAPAGLPDSKHVELVDDFLSTHGDALLTLPLTTENAEDETSLRSWFDQLVSSASGVDPPFLKSLQGDPCILSIITTCLQARGGRTVDVLKLYVSLIHTTTELCQKTLKTSSVGLAEGPSFREGDFTVDNETSSVSSDDDSILPQTQRPSRSDEMKVRQWSRLLHLLLERVLLAIESLELDTSTSDWLVSRDVGPLVRGALSFCSKRYGSTNGRGRIDQHEEVDDASVFRTIRSLVRLLRKRHRNTQFIRCIDSQFIAGLVEVLIRQRMSLEFLLLQPTGRHGRAALQKSIRKRSEFLGDVCCTLGWELSSHRSTVAGGSILPARVFSFAESDSVSWDVVCPVVCESLVWLWQSATKEDSLVKERLLVPVAAAIVGYCGCAIRTNTVETLETAFKDFFDSDASAMEYSSDATTGEEDRSNKQRILLAVSQVVHCIDNTFGAIDDLEFMAFAYSDEFTTRFGPMLPVVAARVLNWLADSLLTLFSSNDLSCEKSKLWTNYPEGVRAIGQTLDTLLYKAYRGIHGFALVSDGKETAVTGRPVGKRFLPESIDAAVHLYRCVKRAYYSGRRLPPKAALDMIVDSLPPMEDSEKNTHIRRFLFSTNFVLDLDDINRAMSSLSSWEDCLQEKGGINWSIIEAKDDTTGVNDDCMIVRRGISHLLAQAPLSSGTQENSERDERMASCQLEDDFSRKFAAIIDYLSLGNVQDCKGWVKAAQCIIGRADLIADKIGLSKGFSKCRRFLVNARSGASGRGVKLAELVDVQQQTAIQRANGWINYLGVDLSLYCQYTWCSFSSLEALQADIAKKHNLSPGSINALAEIQSLSSTKKLAEWQIAWGGIFVSSLRQLALRCLLFAFAVSSRSHAHSDDEVVVQILEILGTLLYAELSGSQVYGYPMRPMTQQYKRDVAKAALGCFAKEVLLLSTVADKDRRGTWDLRFMIGKVRFQCRVVGASVTRTQLSSFAAVQ